MYVQLKVRNPQFGDKTFITSNVSQIEAVKQQYIDTVGDSSGLSIDRIRFFCLGKELKNELFLYSYEIENNMVVQAMIRK